MHFISQQSSLPRSHAAWQHQHCVNGDRPSQWEMANFDPHRITPELTVKKNLAQLITSTREPHHLTHIWYRSIHWGLLGIWVKYNVFVPFLLGRLPKVDLIIQRGEMPVRPYVCRAVLPSTASPGGGWGSGLQIQRLAAR